MKLRLLAISAALALAAQLPAANAATMQLNSWTWGNGNSVNASTPAYNGASGGFTGTLSGGTGFDGAIDTYCVELTEHFSFGGSYSDYKLVNASSYFTASRATVLGKLISYVFGNNLFATTAAGSKDDLSTALQLAIWNTVYDTDTTLSSGAFVDSSVYKDGNANFAGANGLLAASQVASQAITYDLYVLQSLGNPGHQDQLIWVPTRGSTDRTHVPEPASLALALLALGAAGAAKRRKA